MTVQRDSSLSRSSHKQPHSGPSGVPRNPSLSEFPGILQPLGTQQDRTSSSSSVSPTFSQPSSSRYHNSQSSTHAEPTSSPTSRLPAPALRSPLPQIPMTAISEIINDLQPTLSAFNITIDSEAGLTWIKKVSVKETDATVQIMQAEGEARIDALDLAQGLEAWRVKEETKAKIEIMRKESEVVLDIMQDESEAQIWLMKEESKRRVLRGEVEAKRRENA